MKYPILILSVVLSSQLQAAGTAITPKAGHWQGQHQVLVDGQDVLAQMQKMQQQLLANIPPAQRQMMAGMLPKAPSGQSSECLSAAQVAALKTPEQWLARAQQSLPNCQLRMTGKTANSVSIAGHCQDQRGYSGTLAGQLTLLSSTQMQMQMAGDGHYRLPTGGNLGNGEQTHFELNSNSQWVGAVCPVKGR